MRSPPKLYHDSKGTHLHWQRANGNSQTAGEQSDDPIAQR